MIFDRPPQNENNLDQEKTQNFSNFVQSGRKIFDVFVDLGEKKISIEDARNTISKFLKQSQEYSIDDMEKLFKEILLKSEKPNEIADHVFFHSISLLNRNYESEADLVKDFTNKTMESLKGVMRSINKDIEKQNSSNTEIENNKNKLLKINQELLDFFDTGHPSMRDSHFENSKEVFLNSFKHHYSALLNNEENILEFWHPSLLNKVSTPNASKNQEEVFDLLNKKLDEELNVVNSPITANDYFEKHTRKDAQEFIIKTIQLAEKNKNIQEKCFAYFDTFLKKFNLKTQDIFNPWFTNEKEISELITERHLEKMNELEDSRPGSVRILFDEFGIALFGKYPVEALIDQFDQRDSNLKYGVFATSHENSIDALANEEEFLNFAFLKQNNVALRFFEFQNAFGLFRRLKKLDKRYGKQNKISFGIINAHGADEGKSILLGGSQKDIAEEKDLTTDRVSAITSVFDENPNFLFLSCDTGKENSFASSFSKMTGATVIAPNKPTISAEGKIVFVEENGHIIPKPVDKNKEIYNTFSKNKE